MVWEYEKLLEKIGKTFALEKIGRICGVRTKL